MSDVVEPLTAKANLAQSRAELPAAMGYEHAREGSHQIVQAIEPADRQYAATASRLANKMSKTVVGRWWRRHPLHGAVRLTEPFLETYARKSPARLVAYSAGTGMLLVILKPWKLLSGGFRGWRDRLRRAS